MAGKRSATSELNHDNWDHEEEPEEAGTFRQATKEEMKNRVIKKARRRGVASGEGGPSLFAGFGGFGSSSGQSGSASAAFSFLGGAKNNGSGSAVSTTTPATTSSFSFLSSSTTPSSSFSFTSPNGGGNANKADSESEKKEGGNENKGLFNGSPSSQKTSPKSGFDFSGLSQKSGVSTAAKWTCDTCMISNDSDKTKCAACETPKPGATSSAPKPAEPPLKSAQSSGKWTCDTCMVPNEAEKEQCICCETPKPGSTAKTSKQNSNSAFAPKSTSGFSFGAPSGGSTMPNSGGFKFGATETSGSPSSSGFKFGSQEASKASNTTGSGFKFGTAAASENESEKTSSPASSGFKFGSSSAPGSSDQSESRGFKFGSTNASGTSQSASPVGSGFKFGATSANKESLESSPVVTGFKFGAKKASDDKNEWKSQNESPGFNFEKGPEKNTSGESSSSIKNTITANSTKETSGKERLGDYPEEFLAKIKALNEQVSDWISLHVKQNSCILLTPIFKDYEGHLKELMDEYKCDVNSKLLPTTKSTESPLKGLEKNDNAVSPKTVTFGSTPATSSTSSKPLLGAVFGSPKDQKANNGSDSAPKASFTFGSSSGKSSFGTTSSTTAFSFGTKESSEKNEPVKTFSFSSPNQTSALKPFPSGSPSITQKSDSSSTVTTTTTASATSTSTFSFGSSVVGQTSKSMFTFGSSATNKSSPSATFSFGSKSNEAPKPFSFGSSTTSTSSAGEPSKFSFGDSTKLSTSSPFGTASNSSAPGFSFTVPSSSGGEASNKESQGNTEEGNEESDEPPKVEVKTIVEEDAIYSIRCKLFFMKDKQFKEKGLGMLHLKKVDDSKTQLLVRAETNLGNILLNVFLNDKMMLKQTKNNVQFFCVPNPAIKDVPEGPIMMLVKVKSEDMAKELFEKLEENSKD